MNGKLQCILFVKLAKKSSNNFTFPGTTKKSHMERHNRCIRLCKWLHATEFGIESIFNWIRRLFIFECVCAHRWMLGTEFNGQIARFGLYLWRSICFWHCTTLCARLFYGCKCHRCKLLINLLADFWWWNSFLWVFFFRLHSTIVWAHSDFCH